MISLSRDSVIDNSNKLIWTEEVEEEFFSRMRQKLSEREMKLKKLEDDTVNKVCTFQPKCSKKLNNKNQEEEESDNEENEDHVAEFLQRMRADLEQRVQTDPEKYNRGKYQVDDRPSFRV